MRGITTKSCYVLTEDEKIPLITKEKVPLELNIRDYSLAEGDYVPRVIVEIDKSLIAENKVSLSNNYSINALPDKLRVSIIKDSISIFPNQIWT